MVRLLPYVYRERDEMIRTLVIDDEKPSRDELKFLLAEIDGIEISGEAGDGIEAVKLIVKLEPDIIFLDVQMPEMSGIELAESIQHMKNKPYIVFTTAYDNFAIKAFDLGAIDYILKPYSKGRIIKSIEKYKEFASDGTAALSDKLNEIIKVFRGKERKAGFSRITVVKGENFHPLKPEDIVAVIASGKKTRIVALDDEYEDTNTITHFEEILPKEIFFRSHRSYIINLDYIKKIGIWFNNTYQLTMENLDEKVPVSRSRVHDFRQLMAID